MHRRNRLRSGADLSRVMRGGARTSAPGFVLFHRAPGHAAEPRIGFSTSRALGSAVVRNRTRRRLRETIRAILPRMVSCDVVVVARPDVVGMRGERLAAAMEQALSTAGLLAQDPDHHGWTSGGTMGEQNPSSDVTEGTSS
jgi:ribonuclease P protein component